MTRRTAKSTREISPYDLSAIAQTFKRTLPVKQLGKRGDAYDLSQADAVEECDERQDESGVHRGAAGDIAGALKE